MPKDSKKSLLKRLKKLERKTALMAPEVKEHCREVANSSISGTQAFFDLTLVGQGDTSATRDGSEIKLKSVVVRFMLNYIPNNVDPRSDTDRTEAIRIILVRYKGHGNVVDADSYPNSATPALRPYACWNKNLKETHYTILCDKLYSFDHWNNVRTGVLSYACNYGTVSYDPDISPTVPSDGGLAMMVVGNGNGNNPVGLSFTSETAYIDN